MEYKKETANKSIRRKRGDPMETKTIQALFFEQIRLVTRETLMKPTGLNLRRH